MRKLVIFHAMLLVAGLMAMIADAATGQAAKVQDTEAAKAPYANDLGPAELDVSDYPERIQKGYQLLQNRCARCHTAARPLNAEFVEVKGKLGDQKTFIEDLKDNHPEMFGCEEVWKIEPGIWKRYVKRMMRKPGCKLKPKEARAVWEFLVYDGQHRKLGESRKSWREHREKLLAAFKEKHPQRYEMLYGKKAP